MKVTIERNAEYTDFWDLVIDGEIHLEAQSHDFCKSVKLSLGLGVPTLHKAADEAANRIRARFS